MALASSCLADSRRAGRPAARHLPHHPCGRWPSCGGGARREPPRETGPFRPATWSSSRLDPTIRLDIRYATADNFLSTPVYTQARAFLQRPAAEALVRAHRTLAQQGYGLLIHDAYRPWYVTKMFWEATPGGQARLRGRPRQRLAPQPRLRGRPHALRTRRGRAVEMPSVYDEMSERAYPAYPGGTLEQRAPPRPAAPAMEREGFAVYESEWWHFDYSDWREYPILNVAFRQIRK